MAATRHEPRSKRRVTTPSTSEGSEIFTAAVSIRNVGPKRGGSPASREHRFDRRCSGFEHQKARFRPKNTQAT
jgi:hypothetical protein